MTEQSAKVLPTPGAAVVPISHDDLRDKTRRFLEREGISQNKASKQIGISSSSFSQWMGGTYRGDDNAIAAAVITWMNKRAETSRIEAVLPAAPRYIKTPTSERIYGALNYAQIAGDISVVYSGAGLGKTSTINHYAGKNPNVWVTTCSPATASVGVMLEEMAMSMGLRDYPLHPARLQRAIVKQVQDTQGLLIVDEAQHLTKAALEAARSIHDFTRVGMAFLGNQAVYNRMYAGGDNGFAQFFSRIGRRVRLTRPVTGDVDAVAAHFGVKRAAELKLLLEIAQRPGALRMVVKVLRLAALSADGGVIGTSEIRAALQELQGDVVVEGDAS
jgi:DNA transposition AAA+ family ATPase